MKWWFVFLLLMPVPPALADEPAPAKSLVDGYCGAIGDKAAEARAAWQTQQLTDLQKRIEEKLVQLETKRNELQSWVEKRDAVLKSANRSLVDIYAKMDPEAAAAQLARAETATAVSVLHQLNPRGASAILDAMDADKAAALVKLLAATAKDDKPAGGGT